MESVLGRYRVLKHLTSGGMADVLLGRADGIEGFERHVVLKRIRGEHARDRRFISMFIDEARLAAGLHHQSIVQVFDIGEEHGEYFFAMEYIHGEDLRRLLAAVAKARAHVPLQFVCAIVSAAASALHYAHERRDSKGKPLNIVHRDVSPSNILISYDGAVKVVDFGIAKAAMRKADSLVGSVNGKCAYMSPEQCKGENVDRRSDVYGLGVLLYELATTSRLVRGDNEYVVMDAIVNGRVTLPQVRRPDLPNELSSIIMRAIATDPARRYQTADELRVDLDELAARSYPAVTAATLAAYMKKIFGVRPEPWLDLSAPERPSASTWDIASDGGRESRRSGSLLPRTSMVDISTRGIANETAPTQRFGFEAARSLSGDKTSKLMWIAGAAAVVLGIGVWQLAADGDDGANVVGSAASTTPPVPSTVAAGPAQAEAAAQPGPTPGKPVDSGEWTPAPVIEPPIDGRARADVGRKQGLAPRAKTAPRPSRADGESEPALDPQAAGDPSTQEDAPSGASGASGATVGGTSWTAPEPAADAAAPVAPASEPAAGASAPTNAEPPAPLPAAPATPQDAEIPTLSNATVSAIASDHAAQLAKCEGDATLKGDVTVSFQIDGNGKVVKSQLSSTIKNPKVAACVLRAVQSWKFAKPPSGAAKGVYTISYQ